MFLRPKRPSISFKFGGTSGTMPMLKWPTGLNRAFAKRSVILREPPGGGHWRKDLTDEQVKFFPIYSYLIVYRPETSPLQVVAFYMAAATWKCFSRIAYESAKILFYAKSCYTTQFPGRSRSS